MKILNLDDLKGLPNTFFNRLLRIKEILKSTDHLENIESLQVVQDIIVDIDNYCCKNLIIGFHFTRANIIDIRENGLIVRSGNEIRTSFLEKYGDLFTSYEISLIKEAWKTNFKEDDTKNRDKKIFFNFTQTALKTGGAELLLTYFGGEQIYFPIYQKPNINEKLKKIGTPVIIKCKLNANNIKTFIEYPWGKIAVSSFHRTQNPNASIIDQDGSQYIPVPPCDIEIIPCNFKFD